MTKYLSLPIVAFLLVMAVVPWLLTTCAPRSTLPQELREERAHYEATADAIRTLTIVAQRQAESSVLVSPLGTLPPTRSTTQGPLGTTFPSATVTLSSEVTIRVVTPMPTPKSGAVTPSRTQPSSSPTMTIQAQSPMPTVQTQPTRSPTPRASVTVATALVIPTQRLQTIVDTITDEMLTAQARKELANNNISDLSVSFRDDGIFGVGYVTILPGLRQQIQGKGTLMIRNASLVANITSITLDGRDVTEQYRVALEDRVNWGLYQLLPQRFVQAFELRLGSVRVTSGVRTQ